MNNRFLILFLILCFLAPIKATLILLRQHKYEIQLEQFSEIKESELVVLEFTTQKAYTELRWKNKHEFEYNGLMYDVIDIKTKGDIIYYYSKPDPKETKFNNKVTQLLELALRNSYPNKGYQKRINNAEKTSYFTFFALQHPSEKILPKVTNYVFNYLSVSSPPPTPPPKQVYLSTLA